MSQSSTRKAVRLALQTPLQSLFNIGKVYTTRDVDARDGLPYANVFMSDGAAITDGLQRYEQSGVVIGVHLPWEGNDDDALDDWGDKIENLIEADTDLDLDADIQGFIYEGYEYGEPDDSAYIRLYLRYRVQY